MAFASRRLLHMRDIRLFNNAGMALPVCEAGRTFLRVDCGFDTVNNYEMVNCPRCKKQAPKRYPWASFGKR